MIVIQRDLSELKQEVKNKIHKIKKDKENYGILINVGTTAQYRMSCSLTARTNIQAVLNAYQSGVFDTTTYTLQWKFDDGQFVTIGYTQLQEMLKFMMDYLEKLFEAEKNHYASIDSLTTREAIKSYDINLNWPDNNYLVTTF